MQLQVVDGVYDGFTMLMLHDLILGFIIKGTVRTYVCLMLVVKL